MKGMVLWCSAAVVIVCAIIPLMLGQTVPACPLTEALQSSDYVALTFLCSLSLVVPLVFDLFLDLYDRYSHQLNIRFDLVERICLILALAVPCVVGLLPLTQNNLSRGQLGQLFVGANNIQNLLIMVVVLHSMSELQPRSWTETRRNLIAISWAMLQSITELFPNSGLVSTIAMFLSFITYLLYVICMISSLDSLLHWHEWWQDQMTLLWPTALTWTGVSRVTARSAKIHDSTFGDSTRKRSELTPGELCAIVYQVGPAFFSTSITVVVYSFDQVPLLSRGPLVLSLTALIQMVLTIIMVMLPGRLARREAVIHAKALEVKRNLSQHLFHEMRTPMNIVSIGLDIITEDIDRKLKDDADYSEIHDLVGNIKHACSATLNVLNDVLSYEKMDAGKLTLERSWINLETFLASTCEPFSITASQKNVCLELFSSVIPDMAVTVLHRHGFRDCEGSIRVLSGSIEDNRGICAFADAIKLAQALRNLLSNAIKFTPSTGKVTVCALMFSSRKALSSRVAAGAGARRAFAFSNAMRWHRSSGSSSPSSAAADAVRFPRRGTPPTTTTGSGRRICLFYYAIIFVSDSGAGIAPENLGKLFKDVVQFDANTLQQGGGSGFGLLITKAIMDMHDGAVGALSAGLGRGSTFYLIVPIELDGGQAPNGQQQHLVHSFDADPPHAAAQSQQAQPERLQSPSTLREDGVEMISQNRRSTDDSAIDVCAGMMVAPNNNSSSRQLLTSSTGRARLGSSMKAAASSSNLSAVSSPSMMSSMMMDTTDDRGPPLASAAEAASVLSQQAVNSSLRTLVRTGTATGIGVSMSPVSAADVVRAVGAAAASSSASKAEVRKCILVVDDSKMARRVTGRLLTMLGYDFEEAEDGADCLTMVHAREASHLASYDAVLIDNYMPKMNGSDAVRTLREEGYGGYIVGLSGLMQSDEVQTFVGCGANLVLQKPVTAAQLAQALSRSSRVVSVQ